MNLNSVIFKRKDMGNRMIFPLPYPPTYEDHLHICSFDESLNQYHLITTMQSSRLLLTKMSLENEKK